MFSTVCAFAASLALLGLVNATQPVEISLQTSFSEPSFLTELLETAAIDNPSSYPFLIQQIAKGDIAHIPSEQELYRSFLDILKNDAFFSDPHALELFELSVAARSGAPRVAAHYQFYNSVAHTNGSEHCPTWLKTANGPVCTPDKLSGFDGVVPDEEMSFDRVIGSPSHDKTFTLYTDLSEPAFSSLFSVLLQAIEQNLIALRIRYLPPANLNLRPFNVQGYGAQLSLKRTDYLVIDDRSDDRTSGSWERKGTGEAKPLTPKQIEKLSLQAASYVMDQKKSKLDTMVELLENFPANISDLVRYPLSDDLVEELQRRPGALPPGFNGFWMNGLQIKRSDVDLFHLLTFFRHEQQLLRSFRSLGIAPSEAIALMSHPVVNKFQADFSPQRFDSFDRPEGGDVILWLNKIETDPMYATWSSSLEMVLQPFRPGALPPLRREIHTIIAPVDLSNREDVDFVINTLQKLIRRRVPVQIGIVPLLDTETGIKQAEVYYYLRNLHGNAAALGFLEFCLHNPDHCGNPQAGFDWAMKKYGDPDQEVPVLDDVGKSEETKLFLKSCTAYLDRLGLVGNKGVPMTFANGVEIIRNAQWFDWLRMRMARDLNEVQRAVYEQRIDDQTWVPSIFLEDASPRRNSHIVPMDRNDITVVDLAHLSRQPGLSVLDLPKIEATSLSVSAESAQLILALDFDSQKGRDLARIGVELRTRYPDVELVFLHTGKGPGTLGSLSQRLWEARSTPASIDTVRAMIKRSESGGSVDENTASTGEFWVSADALLAGLSLTPNSNSLILNGRVVTIPDAATFQLADFELLLVYEQSRRLEPIYDAASMLGIMHRIKTTHDFAVLSSIVSLSTVPIDNGKLFEDQTVGRTMFFDDLEGAHTMFSIGDPKRSTIHIVAIVDPLSEDAQKWSQLLKALAEMSSVSIRVFMNPRDDLKEVPINRFYRYVMNPKLDFDESGAIVPPRVRFLGLPTDTLLTMGLDVPSAWLVAAKESVYDLDNLSLYAGASAGVKAVYELESILIEGHARDVTQDNYARGAQLVLSTSNGSAMLADTIVMDNLGYFQLKANPGHYRISLKEGASRDVFQIDTVGNQARPDAVAVLSFEGVTLWPRLSRRPGMEGQDVLLFANKPQPWLDRAWGYVGKVMSRVGLSSVGAKPKHAEINIFSVASGHLYERMLNIMMVSVMRHTKHSVKFWFIEQFLSPSFKQFIPHMAAAYGFEYEMVTYKWPHWLRGQKEKQREIWGYKILFLDVLFPLDLDKVIFVDADQIVRTDMKELIDLDLDGAPYGFTPMCDSRESMDGYRFWKTGYWAKFLQGRPYHISALYVVDLGRFRELAAGDRLRQQYQKLSQDPESLSNLDQDLPNNMQFALPIHSLPQEWLWCETWCSDESLERAKTIDLCNNPQTREPKLDRARRQVPEWTRYDDEIRALAARVLGARSRGGLGRGLGGGLQGGVDDGSGGVEKVPSSSVPGVAVDGRYGDGVWPKDEL